MWKLIAVHPASLVSLYLSDNSLDADSVDYVLASLVANGKEGGECLLYGGTNAVPRAAGLANRDILVSRGWYVYVNS
jgi:hypothetical protein